MAIMDDYQTGLKVLHKIERDLSDSIPMPERAGVRLIASAIVTHFKSKQGELVLTDYLLSAGDISGLGWEQIQKEMQQPGDLIGQLESVLKDSRSKWTVGVRAANRLGLVQRVPDGVQMAADRAIQDTGHAGRRLAEAWGTAYGLNPDPTKAYGLAVKAVEDAALPKVPLKPNDHKTLGSVIRALNSAKYDAADWTLEFQREDKHYSNGQTLVAMLKTLWSGQTDRHGGDHEFVTDAVITQESAEAAVMLAVPLVQWFSSGFVVRSESVTKLPPE